MNTEDVSYSQFAAHAAKLKAEGKRIVNLEVRQNGYRITAVPMRPHQPELDTRLHDTSSATSRLNSETNSHHD